MAATGATVGLAVAAERRWLDPSSTPRQSLVAFERIVLFWQQPASLRCPHSHPEQDHPADNAGNTAGPRQNRRAGEHAKSEGLENGSDRDQEARRQSPSVGPPRDRPPPSPRDLPGLPQPRTRRSCSPTRQSRTARGSCPSRSAQQERKAGEDPGGNRLDYAADEPFGEDRQPRPDRPAFTSLLRVDRTATSVSASPESWVTVVVLLAKDNKASPIAATRTRDQPRRSMA